MAAIDPSNTYALKRRAAFGRLDVRRWMLPIGVAAFTGIFGLVAAVQPRLAIVAAFALVLVALIFANLVVGLCVFTVVAFLDVLPELAGGLPTTKAVGLLLVAAWLLRKASDRVEGQGRTGLLAHRPWLAGALLLFLAWTAFSMLWAEQSNAAADSLSRFALNFALFPILFTVLRARHHVAACYAMFVVGALLTTAWGIATHSGVATRSIGPVDRLGGAGLSPNELGTLLAIATVLAVTLSANRSWPPAGRVLMLASAGACMFGMFRTLSREAFLGLAIAVLVAPFAAGRGRRAGATALAVLAIFGTAVWFEFVAPQSAIVRITHGNGGSGREDLWKVGWRMVEANPIRGVGAGNFPISSIHYLLRPGLLSSDKFIVNEPKVPHNIYLSVLAELGVIGLALFASILAFSLWSALSAARIFARCGDPGMEVLARGLFIALIAFFAADFFSSQLFSKQLWLLLATGPALRAIADRRVVAGPE